MNTKFPSPPLTIGGRSLVTWYCPALAAYLKPGVMPAPERVHLLTQLEWIPLYAGVGAAEGWTLRGYYSLTEAAYYASHRTMSEKTANLPGLVELYAPPGAIGNDTAGHVPPKP